MRDKSPIGLEARRYMERGQLVPDDITIQMLLDRLTAPDAAEGVILDGFPRNRAQAEALATALAERGSTVDRTISIDVPDRRARSPPVRSVGLSRLRPRLQRAHEPAPGRGVCDLDGSPLIQRADDKPETIRARLSQQLASLGEVADYYDKAGLLRVVDGVQPIDAVTEDLLSAITDPAPNGAAGAV